MYALVKKDFQTNRIMTTYVAVFILIFIMYLIALPPTVTLFLLSFGLGVGIFSYDDKNTVNRYLLSMPIKRDKIVKSRYVYAIGMILYTIAAQLVVMFIFHLFSWDHLYVYTWREIITVFGLISIIFALSIPIIYALSSLVKAMFFILLIIAVASSLLLGGLIKVLNITDELILNELDPGFALIIEHYFPTPSYFVFLVISILLLYLSMLLSVWIFKNKDL